MRIGVLGGGQLGGMLALAGAPLGMRFRFLDPDPCAPAGAVGELHVGAYEDEAALARFVRGLDAVTFEFENVPASAVRWLASRVHTFPGAGALETAQDRALEKACFRRVGLGVPEFACAGTKAEFDAACGMVGLPVVVKTRRMGYDGKGQAVVRHAREVDGAWARLGEAASGLIVERLVEFEAEVSLIGARARDGATRFYPLVRNEHSAGILRRSIVPVGAVGEDLQSRGEGVVRALMDDLGYVGVLAVEMFVARVAGRLELLGNEMAPRVHNSGHWTIEGAETGQFEQHLRAGLGLPLGGVGVAGPSVMLNMVGGVPGLADLLSLAGSGVGVYPHLYGKEPRAGRKLGHLTLVGRDWRSVEGVEARARALIDPAWR